MTPKYCRDCGTAITDENRSSSVASRCTTCQRIIWEKRNRQRGIRSQADRLHLNKAAPEMYEALFNLLNRLDADKDVWEKGWWKEEREAAYLAVRKARGE